MEKQKNTKITVARAYNICLRFLAPRPRSISEVRRHLSKKETAGEVIEIIIEKLSQENLLNDEDFARMFVESRERHKPRSRFALGCELRQKGIKDNLIDKILENVDEETSAWNAVSPRLRTWRHLDIKSLKKKVFNYLQYRGFGYEVIMTTWNRVYKKE